MTTDKNLEQVDLLELVDLFDVGNDEPTIYIPKKEIDRQRVSIATFRAYEEEKYEKEFAKK